MSRQNSLKEALKREIQQRIDAVHSLAELQVLRTKLRDLLDEMGSPKSAGRWKRAETRVAAGGIMPARGRALGYGGEAELEAAEARPAAPAGRSDEGALQQLIRTMSAEGAQRFEAMIDATGGALPVEGAAQLTGASEDALRKATQRGQVLAYKVRGRLMFPVCQFRNGQLPPQLREVIAQLPGGLSDRGIISFFLSPIGSAVASATPLELLWSGDPARIELVKQEAARYLEHVGA